MANSDRPMGFRPVKSLIGAPWSSLVRRYEAADRSSDTTNNHGDIYIGDPVALSSGKAVVANSGDTIVGVCVGVGRSTANTHGEVGYFNADDLSERYAPLSDAADVYIAVVPAEAALFEVQSESDLDLAVGALADITVDATEAHGDRTTGNSSVEIKAAVNNDVRVVEYPTNPDNDVTLANANYIVKFQTTLNSI